MLLTVRIFGGAVTTLRWSLVFKYVLTLPIKLSASQFWTIQTFPPCYRLSLLWTTIFWGPPFVRSRYFDVRNRLYVG
ncbi:hypothetical protein B0H14DRAFT_2896926, partial [Mycena olivaceomarginata]